MTSYLNRFSKTASSLVLKNSEFFYPDHLRSQLVSRDQSVSYVNTTDDVIKGKPC